MKPLILLVLSCIYLTSQAAIVDTISLYSPSMHKEIKNVIILPDSYTKEDKSYPSLYLLHGATGNYATWVQKFPEVKQMADELGIVIICPDGGSTSWYLDSPIDPSYQYETYVAKELFSYVEKNYRLLKDRESRAIMGFSMGGHGALFLSSQHPNIWSIALSSSGGLDLTPFPTRWDIAKRIGNQKEYPNRWKAFSMTNQIEFIKDSNLKIFVDCGTEDFFYSINEEFHQKLLKAEVAHTYLIRKGGHTQEYWAGTIPYQVAFLKKYLKGIRTTTSP